MELSGRALASFHPQSSGPAKKDLAANTGRWTHAANRGTPTFHQSAGDDAQATRKTRRHPIGELGECELIEGMSLRGEQTGALPTGAWEWEWRWCAMEKKMTTEAKHRGGRGNKTVPVGAVNAHVIRGVTLLRVKVNNNKPFHQQWRPLAHVVWEHAHGPLPPGFALWFKDRNSRNCRLENLEPVTRADVLKRNIADHLPKCRLAWAKNCSRLGKKFWRDGQQALEIRRRRLKILAARQCLSEPS